MKRGLLTFAILLLVLGTISGQTCHVGDLFTFSDGSKGVVFHIDADGANGWAVALRDASTGCPWGNSTDVPNLVNFSSSGRQLLVDTAGYSNTLLLRNYQNANSDFAAGVVDFENGWYLPTTAQLRVLFSRLPFISATLLSAGGDDIAYDSYWSCTECSAQQAWGIVFSNMDIGTGTLVFADKSSVYRVRAVRTFTNRINTDVAYLWNTGDTTSAITVTPTQTTTYTVTVSSSSGCDGVATHTIAVKPPDSVEFAQTVCESYEWNGQVYTERGDYTQTFVNQYGCDSVVTLHLMVNRGTHHVTDTAVCDSYTWTHGTGDTYTESGTYTFSYTNADGCPSADTLHLSMMDLIAVTVAATTDTVCPGDSVTLYADAIAPSMVDSHVPPVAVGDILCTDNSIVKPSEWPVPGKTAMGIVCYVDNSDEHGWAIHLHDYGTRVAWSTTSTDISGLANFATGVTAITDLDGYTNTQRIRSAGNASTYPAAYAVDFAQGWYLPASAQMRCVYSKIPILNASLQMVGGTPFSMTAIWGYWSSTEADSSRAWHLDENGQITSYYKTTNYLVRSARNF